LGIIHTRFATIVIAAATVEDLFLWGALTVATGIASSGTVSVEEITKTVLLTVLFLGVGLFLLPRIFKAVTELCVSSFFAFSALGYALLTGLSLTVLAGTLGINIIFGALIAGITLGDQPDAWFREEKKAIKHFSLAFFIPIYFAIVGLRLDLIHDFDPLFFVGFLIFAVTFKLLGTLLSAKLTRLNWLSSLNLAVAMNARGGPGIVLATVAFDTGIINESFFATLILLAIVTSLFAGYWFKAILNRNLTLLD
jgi:Kef-type K+ transport system membrane component KefB